jgi:hypothetical protein
MRAALAAVLLVGCSQPAPKPVVPPTPVAVVPADAPGPSQEETLAAIQKAMNELDEAAQGCWARAATERFDIEGEVSLQVEIEAASAKATIVTDRPKNAKLSSCLVALLGAYRWAPPLYGQTIQIPFKFNAPDGQSVIDRRLVDAHVQGNFAVSVLPHDTARIMNVMGGDVSKVKLAVSLLFTYPGVPCVYYGDEIGLSGDSHHNRGTMPWDPQRWNMDLRSYYQKLIRLRRESSALKVGGFQWMAIGKDEFSFLRESSAEWLICWACRNSSERLAESIDVSRGGIPDGTIFTEFFTRQTAVVTNGSLTIRLPDQNFSIWIAQRQTE